METELQDNNLLNKNKLEQMAVLVRHYKNQLESQRVQRNGVETVSRLLAESRQENVTLKKSLKAMETRVKNLQNRLTINGISLSAENVDNEVIVPCTSKQTLTNLAVENKRLRSMLLAETGSEKINENDSLHKENEITEAVHVQQQLVDKLKVENKSMKMKLSDLETLFKSSNNEKDKQLVLLRDEIQQLKQMKGPKIESIKVDRGLPALKEQLRAFMSQCQDFQMQLDNVHVDVPTEVTGIELAPVLKQAVEGADNVDGVDVKQLLDEKQKLQDRVEEVTTMNQRWQDFFGERDRYIQSLEQKVHELNERLKDAMRSGPTQEINRRIEQVLEKSQKEVGLAEELKQKAEEEVEQLRQELTNRDSQILQLQNQVTILSCSPNQQSTIEANSTIEHLKAQIQVCTEDFEKERQDRQVALQEVASLKQQNARLHKLNTHLQTLICSETGQSSRPTAQEHGHDHEPRTLQPRGVHDGLPVTDSANWKDYPDFDSGGINRTDTHPGLGTESLSAPENTTVFQGQCVQPSFSEHSVNRQGPKQNILTCPKCNKEFAEEQQTQLLIHMDMCWE